jgi:hypothetical protein
MSESQLNLKSGHVKGAVNIPPIRSNGWRQRIKRHSKRYRADSVLQNRQSLNVSDAVSQTKRLHESYKRHKCRPC